MKLTNQQIYNHATNLVAFSIEGKLPVKINFFLQKNIRKIIELGQEIDLARFAIGEQFGEPSPSGGYQIPPEKMGDTQKELNDLFNLEQEVDIHIFNLDDFDNIELTTEQLTAIMFMIEE